MNRETLRCVGGPFDGREITTEGYNLTLILSSLGELAFAGGRLGASVNVVRNTYTRRQMTDGTAHWQFENATPLYLHEVADVDATVGA